MTIIKGKKVYLARGKNDMHKSINGLAAIAGSSFRLNLFDEAVFVFCDKNRVRLKILEADKDGFGLYVKRLDKGQFRCPAEGFEAIVSLSPEELQILLSGAKVELKLKRNEVSERQVI